MRRAALGIVFLLGPIFVPLVEGAQPKAAPAQPAVDGDQLPSGEFIGVLMRAPDSDRMFTLKITYPEVQLKPGAKPPSKGSVRMPHVQTMHQQFHQMRNLQRQLAKSGNHHAVHHVMQLHQVFAQMQMNQAKMAQQEARLLAQIQKQQVKAQQQAMQQELKQLQQQIKTVQKMYRVVQVSRNFDFQAEENVKVRIKDLPEQFDDKGNIKKYTKQELDALKGKDKNLVGYESSPEALKTGQLLLVTLRVHKKPKPPTPSANKDTDKDKDKDKDADKDKDKDKDTDTIAQHKMQVRLIVILQESNKPQNSTTQPKKKK